MKTNLPVRQPRVYTHEGAPAMRQGALKELRRTLSTCLLFEDTFYEKGVDIAARLHELGGQVSKAELIAEIKKAKDAGLRHAPLWMLLSLTKYHKGAEVGDCIADTIRRADELAELVALYWKNGKKPLSKQLKRGLSIAFNKFSEYQLAKYNRDGAVKLRDVLFLCHAKPESGVVGYTKGARKYGKECPDDKKSQLFKKIVDGTLETPDTWEVALSSGADKKATWERLLAENKLGALALLRNLRNMEDAGVHMALVAAACDKARVNGILPFQFVSAYKNSMMYSRQIEDMMLKALKSETAMDGSTIILIDVSGSMDAVLSSKSKADRLDAAGSIAVGLAERCQHVQVFTFSNQLVQVPSVRGFGLMKAITDSQSHGDTKLGGALRKLYTLPQVRGVKRLIVITDEQTRDSLPSGGPFEKRYMVNVAPYQYGVAMDGNWVRIDGFSANTIDWIIQEESDNLFQD